jgi:hypothetical protein
MHMTDKNRIIVGLGLILVSNIIGHFAPPFSISVSPILLPIIIAGINRPLYKSDFYLTVIYNFGLLLFNDLLIRSYAGGTHDQEGKGWIAMFFMITYILACIIMIIYSFIIVPAQIQRTKAKSLWVNISIVLIASVLTGLIYYYLMGNI